MLKVCNTTTNGLINYKILTQHHCIPREELHESHHRSPLSLQLLHYPIYHPVDKERQQILEAILACKINFRVPYFTQKMFQYLAMTDKNIESSSPVPETKIQTRYLPSKCYTNQVKRFKIITNYKYTNMTEFQMNYVNDTILMLGNL